MRHHWIIGLAALLLALAGGAGAASALELKGATWRLSVSMPAGPGPHPAVILLPGCTGNWPAPVKAGLDAHAKSLVRRGYAAAQLDVLGPRGYRTICARLGALLRLERAAARDAIAAARRIGQHARIDANRIAFLGQSFGGSVALRLASQRKRPRGAEAFRAIIAYYPWCADRYGRRQRSSDFAVPVLILTGSADTWTPAQRCTRLRPVSGSSAARIQRFAGAHHSFDAVGLAEQRILGVNGRHTVAYSAAATRASRRAYSRFLARSLGR